MSNKPMVYAPASKKQELFLNSKATITLAGGAAGCFDAETEYLTPQGWKYFKDYQEGDLVAQYNPDNNNLEFVYPKEYIKLPADNLTRMQTYGLDFCLSDEHRVLYINRAGYNVTSYKEFIDSNPTDNDIRLIPTRFTLSNLHNYNSYYPDSTLSFIEFLNQEVNKYRNEPLDNYWYSANDMELVLLASLLSIKETTLKCNIDIVQFALIQLGKRTTYKECIGARHETIYVLELQAKSFVAVPQDVEFTEYKTYDGFKYCFSVDSTFLIVRRSTGIYITGNSGKALRHGEKVLTPNGFKNIEDMQVGDEVVTPKNTIEKVTGVYPQGKVPIHRVTFADGRTIDCCPEHLWAVEVNKKDSLEVYNTNRIIKFIERGKHIEVPCAKQFNTKDRVAIKDIKYLDVDYATCISISGDDKLFITSNFIVTHNTYTSLLIALKFMQHPRATGVIFRK